MMFVRQLMQFREKSCHYWKALLLIVLAVITWLALNSNPPQLMVSHGDKINHIAAFMALTGLVWLSFLKLLTSVRILLLLSYGLAIELLQSQFSHRTASIGDIAADGLGILIAEAAIFLLFLYSRENS